DAIDSRRPKTSHPNHRRGFGIRFERDLRGRIEREGVPARRDQTSDFFRLEERRGPAAEKNCVGRLTPSGAKDLLLHGRDGAILERGVEQTAIEVAVVADRRGEGNVEIDPEHDPPADYEPALPPDQPSSRLA